MKSNLATPTARFFDMATWYAFLAVAWVLGIAVGLGMLGAVYCLIGGLLMVVGIHIPMPELSGSTASHGCMNVGKSLTCH